MTGKLSYDLKKEDEQNVLHKMLVAHACNGCSSASLTEYKNNDETVEDEFTGNEKDDRIYIDMRRRKGYTDELEKINRHDSGVALNVSLKDPAAKKIRLRVTGFSQAEYWYLLSNKGYIMSYKNYNISKADTY